MDVKIEVQDDKVYLFSPYNKAMPEEARNIGGRWDSNLRCWRFDGRDEERVRKLARDFYGTDGRPEDAADLVTVRIPAWVHSARAERGTRATVVFAGRTVASREGRDSPVRLEPGVIIVEGEFPYSAGSMQYPDIGGDAVLEIRDLPRAALSTESPKNYTIVEEKIDTDALKAEREWLTARIAEIDAILAGME